MQVSSLVTTKWLLLCQVASMKIVWTLFTIKDLDNAYDYIAATNRSAALDIIERIERAVAALRLTQAWAD